MLLLEINNVLYVQKIDFHFLYLNLLYEDLY